jgi:DNA mismatch repair protein MutL
MTALVEKPDFALPNIEHRLEAIGQTLTPGLLPFAEPQSPQNLWHPSPQGLDDELNFRHSAPAVSPSTDRRLPMLRVIGQMGSTFIIAEGPSGMFLVDQHRAHERVLFDRIIKERSETRPTSQMLLDPVVIDVSAMQADVLTTRLGELSQLGFVVDSFGERSFIVRAVPPVLGSAGLGAAVQEIIEEAGSGGNTADWQEHLVASLACKGAIKAGRVLTPLEMRELLLQLESATMPAICPHGAPIMVHLSQAQLEKQFGR